MDAAATWILRIQQDRERAPISLKPLFSYLEEHLFDQDLNVSELMRRCGKRDTALSIEFKRCAQMAPHEYITAARIETAARLLDNTDLEIWKVTELLGFSDPSILYRNFKSRFDTGPAEFRKGIKAMLAEEGKALPDLSDVGRMAHPGSARLHSNVPLDLLSENTADRGTQGRTAHGSQSSERCDFIKLQPLERAELQERQFAEIWQVLCEEPWDLQREMVRHRFRFSHPGFFYFLQRKSILEGREDRKRGVHISELALDSMRAVEQLTDEYRPDLRCQGWEGVGNARRLAFDLIGAQKAFSLAEVYLNQLDERPEIKGRFYRRKAALRRCQGKLGEAFVMNTQALSLFRSIGDAKSIVETLLESANIQELAGELEACTSSLCEARSYLVGNELPYLKFAIYFNLASVYAKRNDCERAAGLLGTVRRLGENQDQYSHIEWLEGFIAAGLKQAELAEAKLLSAFHGFQRSGNFGYTALAALDLALLYTSQNRTSEVHDLVLATIPILESFGHHAEAASALRLLRVGTVENSLTKFVLREARNHVERLRSEARGNFEAGESIPGGSAEN